MSRSRSGSGGIILDTDRYYENPYLEDDKSLADVLQDEGFQTRLHSATATLLRKLTQLLTRHHHSEDDLSVYTGASGIFLMYHDILTRKPDLLENQQEIQNMLKHFVHRVVHDKGVLFNKKRFTFLCGDCGPLVTAYMVTKDASERSKLLVRILELQDQVFSKTTGKDGHPIPNELLYGRVGYLYALLFLNQEFPQDPQLISPEILSKLVSFIVEDGIQNHGPGEPPLHYEWHEKIYLGAAHGYVGILYILLKARAYMSEDSLGKVKSTLDWLITQQFPSGNLRSSVSSKEDKLVHWCHGSPGAIFLWLEASKVFETEKDNFLASAVKAGEVVWNRGILKRSYSLCHGTAGNAYALLALYKYTKDDMWLRRSCFFAQWCFQWGKHSTREPDSPNSLFEGLSGCVYMLHDFQHFLSSGGSGSNPKFPAFELD